MNQTRGLCLILVISYLACGDAERVLSKLANAQSEHGESNDVDLQ